VKTEDKIQARWFEGKTEYSHLKDILIRLPIMLEKQLDLALAECDREEEKLWMILLTQNMLKRCLKMCEYEAQKVT